MMGLIVCESVEKETKSGEKEVGFGREKGGVIFIKTTTYEVGFGFCRNAY